MHTHTVQTHHTLVTLHLHSLCRMVRQTGQYQTMRSNDHNADMGKSSHTAKAGPSQCRTHGMTDGRWVSSHRTASQLSYCHLGLSRPPHGPGNSTQLSWIQCGKGRGQSTSGFPYQHSCLCDCHVVFHNACGLNFSKLTGCTLMLPVLKNWCYILKPVCTVIVTFMFGEQMEFAQFR